MPRLDLPSWILKAAMGGVFVVLLAPVAAMAQSVELTSESYTLIAPTLSGGGAIDLRSTAAEPTVAALGVTVGQPVVGVSTGAESGIELRAGFWHMVGGAAVVEDIDTDLDSVLDGDDNCPLHPNADQADDDLNGVGNVCECSGPETRNADANGSGRIDGGDYTIWADNFGLSGAGHAGGDFNCDDVVDGADYTVWADNFTLDE